MTAISDRALSFVENSNFLQLREISAVKKTCCFRVEWDNKQSLVEFKFGQLVGVYVKECEIKKVLLNSLLEGCVVPKEALADFDNPELNVESVFKILENSEFVNLKFINTLKENFYLELISEVLFSEESKLYHVTHLELEKLLLNDHLCLLKKCNLTELSVGQLILNVYSQNKSADFLFSQGNCLSLKNGASFELSEKLGFIDKEIPLEDLILSSIGLRDYAIREVKQAFEAGAIEINNVEFVEELDPVSQVDIDFSIKHEARSSDNSVPRVLSLKTVFLEPQASARLIEVISILGLAILLFRCFTFFDSVYGAFLDMQPL